MKPGTTSALRARGVVCKLVFAPAIGCRWLARQEDILLGDPWRWSDSKAQAYVFESFELAETAAAKLKGEGDDHVHAVVSGRGPVMTSSSSPAAPAGAVAPWDAAGADQRRERYQARLAEMHLD